jgi:butyrate kinase
MYKVLAINPGSTSTKIALYEDQRCLFKENLEHSNEDLAPYQNVAEQYGFRRQCILDLLVQNGYAVTDLNAVVGRGGLLPPVKSGAYRVNQAMVDCLRYAPKVEHASNLGAMIAFDLAEPAGIPSFIYDSVAVDELTDLARVSGLKEIPRESFSHMLNMRAVAMKLAADVEKDYRSMNIITAHLGGGISVAIHEKGRVVDIVSDDEGPFSPERSGRIPCKRLVELCFSGKYDERTVKKMLRGNGGLMSYLGTNSALEVEKRIDAGDAMAALVQEAMAYQIAKAIGDLATVTSGEVDYIVITGGMAYSKRITTWIHDRVRFIAPVVIMPGENELEALAHGALRVLNGTEDARLYE